VLEWESKLAARVDGNQTPGGTASYESVTLPHPLQRILEKIARLRLAQILEPVISTERKRMKTPRMLVSDETVRLLWNAYNESL
jgi:hypothetical protein